MKGYPVVFRCYAEKDGDQWVAFCIDLTLAAQADSFPEARQKLHEQIDGYLYDAIAGEDQEFAGQLLSRKAPLRYRAKYHLYSAMNGLRNGWKVFNESLNAKHLKHLQTC